MGGLPRDPPRGIHSMRNAPVDRIKFFRETSDLPDPTGIYPSPRLNSRNNHARANVQSRFAVGVEMPRASAVSSIVIPTKYRSFTTSALRGSIWAKRSRIPLMARISSSCASGYAMTSSTNSARSSPPPCRTALRRLARSIRMRRIASAAALKKCLRPSHWLSPG